MEPLVNKHGLTHKEALNYVLRKKGTEENIAPILLLYKELTLCAMIIKSVVDRVWFSSDMERLLLNNREGI